MLKAVGLSLDAMQGFFHPTMTEVGFGLSANEGSQALDRLRIGSPNRDEILGRIEDHWNTLRGKNSTIHVFQEDVKLVNLSQLRGEPCISYIQIEGGVLAYMYREEYMTFGTDDIIEATLLKGINPRGGGDTGPPGVLAFLAPYRTQNQEYIHLMFRTYTNIWLKKLFGGIDNSELGERNSRLLSSALKRLVTSLNAKFSDSDSDLGIDGMMYEYGFKQ